MCFPFPIVNLGITVVLVLRNTRCSTLGKEMQLEMGTFEWEQIKCVKSECKKRKRKFKGNGFCFNDLWRVLYKHWCSVWYIHVDEISCYSQPYKAGLYHLRNISRIKKYISRHTADILVHAFVTFRLDFCISLLHGLPKQTIKILQYVQNVAARILSPTPKREHFSPVLQEMH